MSKATTTSKGAPTGRRDLQLSTRCLTAEMFSPGRLGALAFDADRGWDLRNPVAEVETAQEIEDQSPFLTVATPGHCELLPAVRLIRPLLARGACLILGHFPTSSRELKALRTECPGLRKAAK